MSSSVSYSSVNLASMPTYVVFSLKLPPSRACRHIVTPESEELQAPIPKDYLNILSSTQLLSCKFYTPAIVRSVLSYTSRIVSHTNRGVITPNGGKDVTRRGGHVGCAHRDSTGKYLVGTPSALTAAHWQVESRHVPLTAAQIYWACVSPVIHSGECLLTFKVDTGYTR